jgi:hypothetical protein
MTGGWTKLHSEELHNLFFSRNIMWAGHLEHAREQMDYFEYRKEPSGSLNY